QLRIVLDAGHGGWDQGTVGRDGLAEKSLVLDIVSRLGRLLDERMGAQVIYTRQNDHYVALDKRTEIANIAQADLFVSVHANYSDLASARGVETYYTNTYSSLKARSEAAAALQQINWTNVDIRQKVTQSRKLAQEVQRALYKKLTETAGVRNRGVKKASYLVLTGTTMPAILAEVSFISSPEDARNLRDPKYRQQIAEALYKGIATYSENSRRVKMASASGKSSGK
ncbi:MAG TPA: N-acetylmuramoyl-L-alanine amidase, partial [Terriglobales bacterium]